MSRVTGASGTAAVSLVSFGRGTAAVPVAQRELQATDTAAVARVTATCDTAAVSLAPADGLKVKSSRDVPRATPSPTVGPQDTSYLKITA